MGVATKGMVLLGVRSSMLPVLVRVNQHVVGWASSVFASKCIFFVVSGCPHIVYVFISVA